VEHLKVKYTKATFKFIKCQGGRVFFGMYSSLVLLTTLPSTRKEEKSKQNRDDVKKRERTEIEPCTMRQIVMSHLKPFYFCGLLRGLHP